MDFAPDLGKPGSESGIIEIADLAGVKSVERGARNQVMGHCAQQERGGRSAGDHQADQNGAVTGFDDVPLLYRPGGDVRVAQQKQAMRGNA